MSLILSLTAEAAAALTANPYFANVDVLALNEKDIQSRIDDALIKRKGVAVVLGTSKLGQPSADVQGGGMLYFSDIVFHATVFENVPVNRATSGSGKFAPDVAETVAALLHWHKPANISECLICVQGPTLIPNPDNKELLVYDVVFKTQGGIAVSPIISTAATPQFSVVSNGNGTSTVTITCSTPYAQVWVTTDGSFPAPIDSTNTPRAPYTVPMVVPSGSLVQARTWIYGYIPSSVAKLNI